MANVINSFSVSGVNAYPVQVEVMTMNGLPSTTIVGLGDTAVKEARQRIEAGITSSGFTYPEKRVVINLAPGEMKKSGSHYDLSMAIGVLIETKQLFPKTEELSQIGFIGELSLNGDIRPVSGVLPMVIAAREKGLTRLYLPAGNLSEASLVSGIELLAFSSLHEIVGYLHGLSFYIPPSDDNQPDEENLQSSLDFSDILGQDVLIEYVVAAAAGGHNMLMIGSPGCGKSMIAKRIPTILPALTEKEALEITKIYSVAGFLRNSSLIKERPLRSPHHNASTNALVGGGSPIVPGEISLAHTGVLFLDEIAEFEKKALDALRQPMEDGMVTVSRVKSTHTFPCQFMLVAAMNPCSCGYYGQSRCRCTDYEVLKYRRKISGPILDRIDVQKYVHPVNFLSLSSPKTGKSSAELREQVQKAREIQSNRFKSSPKVNSNAQMNEALIKEHCELEAGARSLIHHAFEKYEFSARTYNKFLKLARTFADLNESKMIRRQDITAALMSRDLDKDRAGMLVT
ncbi:YifB family Mg chelatase-like AAA ATPase [Dehalobacter sp. DCM]|uniref:YifB family Mg chelatase-like AAA ATPase n=1 Tax=Dehalobacter sp. DCM TaxID=2907827 RepID=UPI0030815F36|nr:YifB family Mg chelatase-like AAA ATPase [Dehalobacter sp. DCM]